MPALHPVGRVLFGVAMAAAGAMQLRNGEFVRLAAPPPAWLGPAAASGTLLLLLGGAIASGYRVQAAALLGGALLLGLLVVKGVPDIASNPRAGFMWTNPAKMLALGGGALILGGRGEKWPGLAPGLLGVFLLLCGVQHFVYAGFVDTLVPAWLPPGRRFWTLFCAVALLAGGVGVLLPRTRRAAGFWSGVMILLWVLLVHLPRTVELKNAFELAGVSEALGLAAVAWLVADPPRAAGSNR